MVSTNDEINERPPEHPEADTILFDGQIDRLADEFEDRWTENSIDQLDEILAMVPESLKTRTRRELFRMDLEIRFKNGLRVDLDGYAERFPKYVEEIRFAHENLMHARRLGEYEYYELLGKGGMGNVYRGKHRLLPRFVAIKVLNKKILDSAGGMERFLQEIEVSGKQQHENIVNTTYAGQTDDRYYLVMEFIEGENLNDIVSRCGPLPIPAACELLRQTAVGLQHVLENGSVHRDIKPRNLMLSRKGVVKIIDFGLGKIVAKNLEKDHALTDYGTTMGSIDYVAPEQLVDAASATIQADIYSLGCVFFFLLTGHAPFDGDPLSRHQKMLAHLQGEMPPLSRFRKECPEEIERFYRKMVAREPQDRFALPSEIIAFTSTMASTEGMRMLLVDAEGPIGGLSSSPMPPIHAESAMAPSPADATLKRYLPGMLLLLLLLTGYGIYHYGTTRKNDLSVLPDKVSSARNDSEERPLIPVKRENAVILQFPGYSGRWWFEEIPYLLPVVREKLAAVITKAPCHSSSEINSVVLPSLASETESLCHLLEFLLKAGETTRKNVADLEMSADRYFSEIALMRHCSASLLHTQAVLRHRLAVLRSEPEQEQLALESYAKAIEAYEAEETESSRYLVKLCRFDLARLRYTISGDPAEFQRETIAITVDEFDDVVFRVYLQAIPALEQMKSGGHQDSVLEEVFQLLKSSGDEESAKAMSTSLHMLYADALARQWRLDIAEREWQTVEKSAVQNAVQAGSSEREARLCAEAVHAKLACASLARYGGDLNAARYRYRDLIGNIQDALDYLPVGKTDSARLTRNLAEAWEGLADTTLFIPTHFGKDAVPNALFFIGEAESGYRQADAVGRDPVAKFVLRCKLALLRFNSVSLGESERRDLWEDIREEYWKISSWDAGFERAREYYRLTEAVLGTSDNILSVRAYLDRNRLNPNPFKRYAGEHLDLQLFAIRTLLASELDGDFPAARQDIKQFLDPILLQHLAPERKTRPFLFPFYDLAIRSSMEDDLVQLAVRIWTARCRHHSDKIAETHLAFYFPLGNVEGFALFLSSDLQKNKRFKLGVTRQQVLEAAKKSELLPLPPELLECLRTADAVDISWDDAICWSSAMAKYALTPERWVFDAEIDRNRLLGIVR